MKPQLVLPVLLLSLACTAGTPSDTKSAGGKTDGTGPQCLFGSSWVQAMDSGNFTISEKRRLRFDSELSALEEQQILAGLEAESQGITDAGEAVERLTDDGTIDTWTVVSRVTDHDPFTVYEYGAGGNPVGFVYTINTMEQVADLQDGSVLDCTVEGPGGCSLNGLYEISGDFESFSTWTVEFEFGEYISSFTDDLEPDEWPTTYIPDEGGTLHSFVQVTDASDAILTHTMHLRHVGCDDIGAVLDPENVTFMFFDEAGTFTTEYEVDIVHAD